MDVDMQGFLYSLKTSDHRHLQELLLCFQKLLLQFQMLSMIHIKRLYICVRPLFSHNISQYGLNRTLCFVKNLNTFLSTSVCPVLIYTHKSILIQHRFSLSVD